MEGVEYGMTREEIIDTLKANLNKTVTLKFTDGFVTPATPLTVDKDGFIHDLASKDDHVFWVSFEEVESVTAQN
jgi:hypothetical protein